MTSELTLSQFINKANIPELFSKFTTILKQWSNFTTPGHFRFNPELYRQIYSDLPNLSDQELCRYYFREGIWYKPLCSQAALDKLLPNHTAQSEHNYNNSTLRETVKRELLDRPLSDLLSKYITTKHKSITKNKYKCVIALQFASLSPIATDLLSIIRNIIQTSEKMNTSRDILLFVNITDDIFNSVIDSTLSDIQSLCPEYIITTSINFGTDIPAYFMMLNYLNKHGINTNTANANTNTDTATPISADYILKLHTKNDALCIRQMTNCFRDGKLEKAMSVLDSVSSIDILGGKELVMPNHHVHDILKPLFTAENINYNQLQFVAGSAFLSRFQTQVAILNKYQDLIRQSVLLCQYVSGWFFQSNSPTHALERIIGGFESQANGKTVKAWL
jgi:hypothetical protein